VTPQQLKNSILQMAMQGKLVEQRPEEGTGEELYQQIQKEKQKLIKEGKIKKEKPLPEITEDEVPFEIPESWKWTYIGEIFQHNTGKALNGVSGPGNMLTYITTSNLYWDRFELDRLKEMPFTDEEVAKCTVQKNDLLVCEGGDFGRAAIWPYDEPIRIQNHIHRLRAYSEISVRYFYYLFYLYKNAGLISGKGIGIQGLSSNALHRLRAPLPPLAEQKHIVAKIEEIMPYIDQYTVAYDHLQSYNTRFPDDLKKSILQQAMEGKLSSQWREDNRVDINSWHKMTVADACHEVKVGIVIRPTRYYTDSTGYKAFRSTNVREFHVQNSDWVYINQKGQDENPRTVVHTGDVLIVRSGNTGTACVVPEEYDGCSGIDIIIAVPNKQIIDPEFLCIFTNSPVGKTQINSGTKGMALTHFGAKSYAKLSINVPSLEEQHYIVEQVKRILPKITMLSRVS
jgi:restriction endonuclease S subunit